MGFAKTAVMFILIALFAMVFIGMAAMAVKDQTTDSYYTNPNNTVAGSITLGKQVFSASSSLMIPMVAVAGILLLMGGFVLLRKF